MIFVKKDGFKEPYSRRKITESMTSAGFSNQKAYKLAISIQEYLKKRGLKVVTANDLREIVIEKLLDIDKTIAEKYVVWSKIRHENIPIVILIGGTSGIGKSSVAMEVAHRLGIKQVIGTDTIREIMKNMISKELMPSIHISSYLAWKAISYNVSEDKIIVGFREQAKAVSAGIEAVIKRSLKEGISLILEGVHIAPELIPSNPNVNMAILYLDDEENHRTRFVSRASATHVRRDARQYIKEIKSIRAIQNYLTKTSVSCKVPIIENSNFEKTVSEIIDITTEKMKTLIK
ncbi:MAG: ATP cone domain-containing protein [Candidatus Methanofastidiosia archaeon]